MNLNQINYFIEVGRYSSISKAAKILHVSQPAISDAIKSLETELGVSLFNRISQRLHLTKEGVYYLEKLSKIYSELNELNQEMMKMGSNKQTIKVGIPPMVGTFLFPRLFVEFNAYDADTCLEVTEGGSLELLDKLRDESIDFAIVAAEVNRCAYHDLSHKVLQQTELLYCAPEDCPLSKNQSVTIQELAKEKLILFKEGYIQNHLIMDAFREAGSEPDVILKTNQLLTIITFIKNKIGTSFLFQDAAKMQEGLVGIHLEKPIYIDLLLIWKTNKTMYPDMKRFMKFLDMQFK